MALPSRAFAASCGSEVTKEAESSDDPFHLGNPGHWYNNPANAENDG